MARSKTPSSPKSAKSSASPTKSAKASASSLPSVPEKATTMPAPVEEYPEDQIDFDDDDPVLAAVSKTTNTTTVVPTEPEAPKAEAQVEPQPQPQPDPEPEPEISMLDQGRAAMAWGTPTYLTTQPGVITALGLITLGAHAATTVPVDGMTFEVTWSVVGIDGACQTSPPTTTSLPPTTTVPTTNPTVTGPGVVPPPKCRFGKFCTKGSLCPFDHTIKPKPCT
ncbi:hypothetical protein BDW02DRAFT_603490 [Decorospora gaudefroyi]|uniref:C3H1-type domain-containing protein n=1 Tax=Decorospora gaudefroyi TaxID=184978 RepID=A0A6A5JY55_9PLEO|nr:hypothetical protein BDW02DRAFT_603490 [Decorospora gaudefroyi]